MKSYRKSRFTLLELLVVIAIIGILMTILVPSLKKARLAAKTSISMTNLRQIYSATLDYANSNNGKLFKASSNFHRHNNNWTTNWSRIVYETMIDEYLPMNGQKAKLEMAKGTTYYSVMYCPLLRESRPECEGKAATGWSDYSMNVYFDSEKRTFQRLIGDVEPLYVPATMTGEMCATKNFTRGSYGPTSKKHPIYEYTNKRTLGVFIDGSLKTITKSQGTQIDAAINNSEDFQ